MKRHLLLIVVALLLGCSEEQKQQEQTQPLISALTHYNQSVYQFEFEGHKYLTAYHGGMVHVESCQCKTNK